MLAMLAASIVASGQTFTCTPTHVWDGDGPVWCAEGPHLRIAGIAAREMDGTCRSNQPCPDASAVEARDALVQLDTSKNRVILASSVRTVHAGLTKYGF